MLRRAERRRRGGIAPNDGESLWAWAVRRRLHPFLIEAAVHAAFDVDWHRLGVTPRYLEPGAECGFGVLAFYSLADRRRLSTTIIDCEALSGPSGFRTLIEKVEAALYGAIVELEKGGPGAAASCSMAKAPAHSSV